MEKYRRFFAGLLTALTLVCACGTANAQEEFKRKIEQTTFVPKGAYVDAQIQRGMAIRNNMKVNKKALNNINKAAKGK